MPFIIKDLNIVMKGLLIRAINITSELDLFLIKVDNESLVSIKKTSFAL